MKIVRFLGAAVFLLFLFFVSIPAHGQVNGLIGEEPVGVFPATAPFTVSILDEAGATADTVKVSNPWSYPVLGYWVRFGGATWTQAKVTIDLSLSGLPEKAITETYNIPGGYGAAGYTTTPFALTDWSSSLYGTGKVVVRLDNGATLVGWVSKVFSIMPYDSSTFTFNKRKNQLIDDTSSGTCVGEAVATVTLNAPPNKLYVSFGWPASDLDMSVEEPDGQCACYSNPSTTNGGHFSPDAQAGGIEWYYIVNGPAGLYKIRAHTHGTAQTARVHIYGANGTVNLNPAAAAELAPCSGCAFEESK